MRLALAAVSLALPASAHAGTQLLGPDGTPLAWERSSPWGHGRPYIPLVANALNRGAVDTAQLRNAVVPALQRWQLASDGAFDWDYWQGADVDVYPPVTAFDGVSSLHFAVAAGVSLGPRTVASTQLWQDPDTRAVVEIDIVLNDQFFEFTDDPSEAGYASGESNVVLLQDVVAHELGHALGFDHSPQLSATMFPFGWPGQDSPGCDDRIGMRRLYPEPEDDDERGSIAGYVIDALDDPVPRAVVTAISIDRAAPISSTLVADDGRWTLGKLPPGEYALMLEPFYAGPEALSEPLRGFDHRLCLGDPWSRRFLLHQGSSAARLVTVTPGGRATVEPMRVGCAAGGADVPPPIGTPEPSVAPELPIGGLDRYVFVERLPVADEAWYRLPNFSGDLRVDVVAYSLFSPVSAQLTLLSPSGRIVAQEVRPVVDEGEDGFRQWDSRLLARDLPRGDYRLQIRGTPLPTYAYPRGEVFLDGAPFAVVILRTDADGVLDPQCAERFEPVSYASPPGGPRTREPPDLEGDDGACGSQAHAAWLLLCVPGTARRRRRSTPAAGYGPEAGDP